MSAPTADTAVVRMAGEHFRWLEQQLDFRFPYGFEATARVPAEEAAELERLVADRVFWLSGKSPDDDPDDQHLDAYEMGLEVLTQVRAARAYQQVLAVADGSAAQT